MGTTISLVDTTAYRTGQLVLLMGTNTITILGIVTIPAKYLIFRWVMQSPNQGIKTRARLCIAKGLAAVFIAASIQMVQCQKLKVGFATTNASRAIMAKYFRAQLLTILLAQLRYLFWMRLFPLLRRFAVSNLFFWRKRTATTPLAKMISTLLASMEPNGNQWLSTSGTKLFQYSSLSFMGSLFRSPHTISINDSTGNVKPLALWLHLSEYFNSTKGEGALPPRSKETGLPCAYVL